jgi:hypothetical protein
LVFEGFYLLLHKYFPELVFEHRRRGRASEKEKDEGMAGMRNLNDFSGLLNLSIKKLG